MFDYIIISCAHTISIFTAIMSLKCSSLKCISLQCNSGWLRCLYELFNYILLYININSK